MRSFSAMRGFAAMLLPLVAGACALAQAPSAVATPKPTAQQQQRLNSAFGRLPIGFEPNRGQTDAAVQYIAHTPGSTVFLTGPDAVFQSVSFQRDAHGSTQVAGGSVVRMHLQGASSAATESTGNTLDGTVNYLHGRQRSAWQTAVPRYSSVRLASVYPGIDLNYHGHGSTLEYDFVVAPQADASTIALTFDGATAKVEANGDLVLPSANGRGLRFDKPVAYQTIDGMHVPVSASFQIAANKEVTFQLGRYDHSRELVIDPTLVFLGTLGTGTNNVDLSQMVVDSSGSMYFIGTTNDSTFPVTTGAYQPVCGPANATATSYGLVYCAGTNATAAFISKLSADGTQLVYSTYLSGHGYKETGNAIAVDAAGVAYLLGTTASDDFPVTADAFQAHCYAGVPHFPGGIQSTCDNYQPLGGYGSLNQPAYFAKLNASGSSLLYASFLGGTQPVYPTAIALDGTGNMYLYGQVNVFSASDLASGQLPSSNMQFTGITSSGYLTIASAKNSHGNDEGIGIAAFLSKFSNDGHTLLYGTFFGDNTTAADVFPQSFAVGANGVAFMGGYTDASNFPVTAGAIKSTCTSISPNYSQQYCNIDDGFVASIDTTKSGTASLVYSTRIGGTATSQGSNIPDEQVYGLAADGSNDAYVTGYTFESTFPVPATGGFQTSCPNNTGNIAPTASGYIDRCDSAFILKLNPAGTAVLAGTYLGGPDLRSAESVGYSVKLDSKGQVYLYGTSRDGGGDFPQVNPLQTYHSGNNLFISAFSADMSKLLFSTRFTNPAYQDHSVNVAGGMGLDASGNIYFTGQTTDTMFTATAGTYQTAPVTGGGDHFFFAKLSKVLQPTGVVASATPNPASQGNNVTYKAVVTGLYQNTPVPTGTVTFSFTNTTPATVIGTGTLDGTGTATLTTAAPAAGTYQLAATYGADSTYDVSTSTAVTFTANSTVSTTTSVLSSAPTAAAGSTITFTASVSASTTSTNTPTGTVTFYDGNPSAGGTMLGTGSVSGGMASYQTSSLALGNHTIYAVYGGDTNFSTSTGMTAEAIVTRAATTTMLASSAATASAGVSVTFTATVASSVSGTPTGTVTFLDGTTTLGTGTLSGGTATYATTTLAVGSHNITASYGGDANFLSSSSAVLTETINAATVAVAIAPTTLTITHGSSGSATITATPTGAYSGSISFSCGTLPAYASCTFSPTTLTFAGSTAAQTATVTINTSAAHALLIPSPFTSHLSQVLTAVLLAPMGLLGFALRRRPLGLLLLLVALTGAAAGLSGCGGSGSNNSTTGTTPVGSYTIPVIVGINGTNSTTNLSVTVQ